MIVFLGCMLILSAAAQPMKRWLEGGIEVIGVIGRERSESEGSM